MSENIFVKAIETDQEGRIIVKVQDAYQSFLQQDFIKKMLKSTAQEALGESFVELAVSKQTFRVTVRENETENALRIVKEEINKNIEMALQFMNGFQG